ncbi:MAG: sialate O-acetylesterase [Planctomycetota bacterium]
MIFSDHAVLQRDLPLPIWGWDTPGKEITVHLAGQRKKTAAGPGGKWLVVMDPLPAGGPHLLSVTGTGHQLREDIWIGEVWVCSGQSNMDWPLAKAHNGKQEVEAAERPKLRLLKIPRRTARTTQWDIDASWQVCTPETAGGFSAVGYFFGRQLQDHLDVPIGLIDAAWPGGLAEAWTPEEALAGSDTFAVRLEQARQVSREDPDGQSKHDPRRPAGIYNGMIAPIIPYAIAGTIWYQGESNAGRPEEYGELLPLLIRTWRRNWGQLNDFAFYIVQLANFGPVPEAPNQGGWAWIREAQAHTAHRTPGSGLVVTIDAGDAGDVHPRDKQTVGRRLAGLALKRTYGFETVEAGPTYLSHRVRDSKVIIRFKSTGQGLVNRGDDENINGFVITGDGEKWHWAEARIQGDRVVVWSPQVEHPTSVRYLWATNPGPIDLYNTANLPAGPFRTDTWLRPQP